MKYYIRIIILFYNSHLYYLLDKLYYLYIYIFVSMSLSIFVFYSSQECIWRSNVPIQCYSWRINIIYLSVFAIDYKFVSIFSNIVYIFCYIFLPNVFVYMSKCICSLLFIGYCIWMKYAFDYKFPSIYSSALISTCYVFVTCIFIIFKYNILKKKV